MPRAFILSSGADTGGCAYRSAAAFAQVAKSDWSVHAMVTNPGNYIQYPEDIVYHPRTLARMYDEADVVVLNNTLYGHHRYDDQQGKPTVLIHHGMHEGSFTYSLPEAIEEAYEFGAVQIGTTVDLELRSPAIEWVPTPVDVKGFYNMRQRLYEPKPFSAPLIIGHFPTDRKVKGTELVIAAVNRLKTQGYNIELLILEGVTNAEVLRVKARDVDILVDQLYLGYGVNAVEAWAMGIPVVAGVTNPEVRRLMADRFDIKNVSVTGLPFMDAAMSRLDAADGVYRALLDLVSSSLYREIWTTVGRVHALKWHSPEVHVRLMTQILERAITQPTVPGPARRPRDGARSSKWRPSRVATTA